MSSIPKSWRIWRRARQSYNFLQIAGTLKINILSFFILKNAKKKIRK